MKILKPLLTILIALFPTVALAGSYTEGSLTSTNDEKGIFYVTGLEPDITYTVRIYELYYGRPMKASMRKLQHTDEAGCDVYTVGRLNQSAYDVIVKVSANDNTGKVITFTKQSLIESGADDAPSCS